MTNCRRCGHEMSIDTIRCEACGEVHIGEPKKPGDNGNLLHSLLGLVLPIVGIILFFVWKKEKPKTARYVIIGVVISMFLLVIIGIVIFLLGLMFNSIFDDLAINSAYEDALIIEIAATSYCDDVVCDIDDELTYENLMPYIVGDFNEDSYELEDEVVIAYVSSSGIYVTLEAVDIGNYEFPPDLIPSESSRDDVVIDVY